MANEFKNASGRASKKSDAARQSSQRHSDDLAKMRQVEADASENLKTAKAKRRKREDVNQVAARIVRGATENR